MKIGANMVGFYASIMLAVLAHRINGAQNPSTRPKPSSGQRNPVDFATQVRPLFAKACIECHGGGKSESGFRLDNAKAALKGGELGRAILPGNAEKSPLIHYVAGLDPTMVMPPKGKRLKATEIAILRQWIDEGAVWPTSKADIVAPESKPTPTWWSLKALVRPTPPSLPPEDAKLARNAIDNFVLAKIREHQLQPTPPADERTLMRRLYFDLIGLPPLPEEIAAFQREFTSSRRADFTNADPKTSWSKLVDRLLESPRYGERWARHWLDVVHYGETHGYDKDKPRPNAWPYRDYVIRAFNEDKQYGRFVQEQIAGDVLFPGTVDGVLAMGFIAAGPWDFIGHAELPESKLDGAIARHLDRDDMVANTTGTLLSMTVHCAQCHDHKFDPISQDDYYGLQAVFAALDRTDRVIPYPTTRNGAEKPAKPQLVYAGGIHTGKGPFAGTGGNGGKPRPISVLARGDIKRPLRPAVPSALACTGPAARFDLPAGHSEGDRRAALARWITHRDNPLVWRSIVNRVWLFHFGRGLVDTPNDFGRMGQLPTHPELLDWLAVEFRDHGQSLKWLHRLIVDSYTYQQTSADNPTNARVDGDNRFLWRGQRRKLEAEAVRDSILYVAGKLDLVMYGPSFQDFVIEKPEHSPHYEYHLHNPEDPKSHRRSIYRFLVRSKPEPFMAALDCADPSQAVEKRNQSLPPQQALALLNGPLAVAMSQHFAAYVAKLTSSRTAQVRIAFERAIGREPHAEELAALVILAEQHGLANACRAIFNLNEFAFVD